ncbi:MAG: hypothetical protein ABSF28_12860 [Terracidiphilus sp.]
MTHSDICKGSDEVSIAALRTALDREGAILIAKGWAMGVDCYAFNIGNHEVCVFIDAWSCDIEGSQEVVDRIKSLYLQIKAGQLTTLGSERRRDAHR